MRSMTYPALRGIKSKAYALNLGGTTDIMFALNRLNFSVRGDFLFFEFALASKECGLFGNYMPAGSKKGR